MAQVWYAVISGSIRGPLDSPSLKSLADEGKLTTLDQVRRGKDGNWVPAHQVSGLFENSESTEPNANRPKETTPSIPGPRTEFPALLVIAAIHKVVAVIAFLIGAVGVLITLIALENGLALAVMIVWTLLAPLFMWGSGEMILVFLRIEQNTRRAADQIRDVTLR